MRLRNTLKSSFFAGLAVVAPLVVTVFVVQLLVNWGLRLLTPMVRGTRLARYTFDNLLVAQTAMGIIVLSLIVAVGWVAQYSIGRRLFGQAGRIMNFIPLVRVIYGSVRQVANSVVNRESRYESVVFVEYPREGVYSVGLVTGDSPPDAERLADEEVYNVFFPSSPNPTQGKLVLVPDSRVLETDLSVRQGIQLLMTTGMAESQAVVEFEEDEEGVGSISG